MSKLEELKKLVSELNDEELQAFSTQFEKYLAGLWDQQIERDAKAGKLDKLGEEALAQHWAGRTRPL